MTSLSLLVKGCTPCDIITCAICIVLPGGGECYAYVCERARVHLVRCKGLLLTSLSKKTLVYTFSCTTYPSHIHMPHTHAHTHTHTRTHTYTHTHMHAHIHTLIHTHTHTHALTHTHIHTHARIHITLKAKSKPGWLTKYNTGTGSRTANTQGVSHARNAVLCYRSFG